MISKEHTYLLFNLNMYLTIFVLSRRWRSLRRRRLRRGLRAGVRRRVRRRVERVARRAARAHPAGQAPLPRLRALLHRYVIL